MKNYVRPTVGIIELRPEERLACGSGTSNIGRDCFNATGMIDILSDNPFLKMGNIGKRISDFFK